MLLIWQHQAAGRGVYQGVQGLVICIPLAGERGWQRGGEQDGAGLG